MRITLSLLVAVLLPLLVTSPAPAQEPRPNIILIMADDLGWGDVGFNGNEVIRTPHLDAMAEAGLRFTRFYSAAPVCSPTRGSCLTGRHPFRYAVYSANAGHMKPEEITLAELLREQGYRTGHFGKWHLGTLTTMVKESNRGGPKGKAHYSPPWQNGFEVCFSTEAKVPTWDPMIKPKGVTGENWWEPVTDSAEGVAYGTHYWNEQGERITDNLAGDDSRVIMDRVLPFVQASVEADRPFFSVIWFHSSHLPVVSGEAYTSVYSEYPDYHRHYFGCITAMDEQVGRLRAELERLGVANDTMIWFCADNGPEGNDKAPGSAGPFRGRKRSLFEGGVRVPGVWVWPKRIEPGTVTDFPAVTSDYLPTILAELAMEYSDDRPLDGMALTLPLPEERTTPIGFQTRQATSWVTTRHKLITVEDGKYLLFDLLDDPSEERDIAAEHPELVARYQAELTAWRESCERSDQGADYP